MAKLAHIVGNLRNTAKWATRSRLVFGLGVTAALLAGSGLGLSWANSSARDPEAARVREFELSVRRLASGALAQLAGREASETYEAEAQRVAGALRTFIIDAHLARIYPRNELDRLGLAVHMFESASREGGLESTAVMLDGFDAAAESLSLLGKAAAETRSDAADAYLSPTPFLFAASAITISLAGYEALVRRRRAKRDDDPSHDGEGAESALGEKDREPLSGADVSGASLNFVAVMDALHEIARDEAVDDAERAAVEESLAQLRALMSEDRPGDQGPHDLANNLRTIFSPLARRKNVSFQVHVSDDSEVKGDLSQIESALVGLCGSVLTNEDSRDMSLDIRYKSSNWTVSLKFDLADGRMETIVRDNSGANGPDDGAHLGVLLAMGLMEEVGGRLEISTVSSGRVLLLASGSLSGTEEARPRVRIIARTHSFGAVGAVAARSGDVEVVDSIDVKPPDVILVEAGGDEEEASLIEARRLAPEAVLIALGEPRDPSAFAHRAPSPLTPKAMAALVGEVWSDAGEAA